MKTSFEFMQPITIIPPQVGRSLLSIVFPIFGAIAASLQEAKPFLEIASLFLGCLGSIFFIASVVKHWNDKEDKNERP